MKVRCQCGDSRFEELRSFVRKAGRKIGAEKQEKTPLSTFLPPFFRQLMARKADKRDQTTGPSGPSALANSSWGSTIAGFGAVIGNSFLYKCISAA